MARLRTALLAVVIGATGLTTAQPASAETPVGVLCGVSAAHNRTLTGQSMEGTITGGPVINAVSLRCRLLVNGSEAALAFSESRVVVARVAYAAGPNDVVTICTDLYMRDGTSWSECDAVATIVLPDGTGRRSSHNSRVHHGGHKKHPDAAPNPYRPQGPIEISSTILGVVNYSYANFSPPLATWTCPPPNGTSVTCTPPPPPPGYTHNVCANVAVSTNSVVPGTAHGTSACATPPHATAASTGPSNSPTQASAAPNTSFPWTCAATTVQTVVWTVRCSVGP